MFRMLINGNRAIDWSGLPLAVEYYGVTDVEGLIHSLLTMRGFLLAPADAEGV